jgi:DNA modification methylase
MPAQVRKPTDPVEAQFQTDCGKPKITVQYRPLTELSLDPRNARVHSKRQVRQIARSIKTFGFIVPILADASGRLFAGHGRYLGAQQLGMTEVPVICVDHLTPEQARAFAIADNRLTENSTWDKKLLAEHFKELAALDLNFSLDTTGFEMGEIDLLIEGLDLTADDDAADEVPPILPFQVSQPGDLWACSNHRVYCGDSLQEASFKVLLGERKADVVLTDPPYNVPIAGHASGLGKTKHRDFAMAAGEMSRSEFIAFLKAVLGLAARFSANGSIHFWFMDWRHIYELIAAGQDIYSELKNICAWVKHVAGMGSFYRSQHEFVGVFKNGKAPHRNNIELGRFGRNRSNVWSYAGVTPFGHETEEGNLLKLHPTVKPVRMLADALMDASVRGDVVLDPFLGSGSTLIAAERVGRICYGIELDPRYVDTAIRRWQRYTGLKATHAVSGKTFDELEAERELANVE